MKETLLKYSTIVAEMRRAQRRYFESRTTENLNEAKKLEILVDEMNKELNKFFLALNKTNEKR